MTRKRKKKPQLPPLYREGYATHGPYTYPYKVYKDNGSFFITFGGKGPFTQAEREEDIERYAQEILDLCIDEFKKEGRKRLNAFYGFETGE